MRRLIIGLTTVLLLTLVTAAAQSISFAQPAAPGTYYKTYTGTDFSPLDSDDVVYWASGTGGGVWFNNHHRAGMLSYLEVRVDLPSGAQVTEVTFYVRACNSTFPPKLYFGAYAPATNGYTEIIPLFPSPIGACDQTQTIAQPVDPPATIDNATQVYVIGYQPGGYYGSTYDSFVKELLVGARVSYQMPGAFIPLVLR